MNEEFKSGFISIIGRPNVGKSTFLNQVLGTKIAIMSDKPQTTRNKIQGVYNDDDAQVIFIDTPGIHKPKHKLGQFMTNIALKSLNQVDTVMFITPANEEYGRGDEFIIENLKEVKQPVILVINKIDLLKDKRDLILKIEKYKDLYDFSEIVPISALTGDNVDELLKTIKKYLPEGPKYFPEDQITDHPERFIIGELIREKVLFKTRDEVPHSVAVIIERMAKREDSDMIDIDATIIVERKSQKGILIGKGGTMLKNVGTLARKDIERLLGSKVYLELWVRVEKDWRNKMRYLNEFGYKENNY